MSLIISLGSNIGDRHKNLAKARIMLKEQFDIIASSRIFKSQPVDYQEQPFFYNQLIECRTPSCSPTDVLTKLKNIEKKMGRIKTIDKGPRNIDLDIIFIGHKKVHKSDLTIPHPSWRNRYFIINPLYDLPSFNQLNQEFGIPSSSFQEASPLIQ